MSSLHNFTATTLAGQQQALADYAGQVVLVVEAVRHTKSMRSAR